MDKRQSLVPVLDRSLTVSAVALLEVGTWLYVFANGSLWQGWLISAMCAGSFLLSVIVVWRHSGARAQKLLMGVFAVCMAILSVWVFFSFSAEAHGKLNSRQNDPKSGSVVPLSLRRYSFQQGPQCLVDLLRSLEHFGEVCFQDDCPLSSSPRSIRIWLGLAVIKIIFWQQIIFQVLGRVVVNSILVLHNFFFLLLWPALR